MARAKDTFTILPFLGVTCVAIIALVPFRSCSPTPILRQRFRSTDGLVGSTLCAAHTMTGIQALPHTHIECIRAISHFEHQARMLDPHGFAAVTAATEDADIYDWLQWKLRHGLSTWNKPGEAGWIWKSRPGRVVRVLVWCTGARESEQTAPYAGEHQYGAQWWPCIVHIPDDDPLAPVLAFYCPALGWANGRPWLVHRSRCWLVPDDYRAILNPAPIKVDKVTDRQRR